MNYTKEIEVKDLIQQALKEDIGTRDITTELFIPRGKRIKAVLLAKEDCVVCGLSLAGAVFQQQDKKIRFIPLVGEGQSVKKGEALARIAGKARGILSAERVALNFLSFLSGVATKTRAFVDAVKPYKPKILDTRKTIPGLRQLQKYAVRIGGGYNHRMSLDGMVMVKDNHLKIINYKSQITNSKLQIPKLKEKLQVEIEVENLREFKEALKLKPDIIMLDNMSIREIQKAVKIRKLTAGSSQPIAPKLEASGGINLKNIRQYAATDVEMISIGALTHSVNSVDISLEVV